MAQEVPCCRTCFWVTVGFRVVVVIVIVIFIAVVVVVVAVAVAAVVVVVVGGMAAWRKPCCS